MNRTHTNKEIPLTIFQRRALIRASSSRFGEPSINAMPPEMNGTDLQPLTQLAIATIINPSINYLDDTDPGGPRFPGIAINSEPLTSKLDYQRKQNKALELEGMLSGILPTVINEGLPFSTLYMQPTKPNPLGIGNYDSLQGSTPSNVLAERVILEQKRIDLLQRMKLLFMGQSSSGKSTLSNHFESISRTLSTQNIGVVIEDKVEQLLPIRNREVTRFDATTANKFMRSLMEVAFKRNQLMLVELPATIPVGDIPFSLRKQFEKSLRRKNVFRRPEKQLAQILRTFPEDTTLFSTIQVDALTSNLEKAQGIIAPIAQDDNSKNDLLEGFLMQTNLQSPPNAHGFVNTNLREHQEYLNHNLTQIFSNLPPVLRSMFAFGVLNHQEVIPMLLPLNQRIGEFKNKIDNNDLPELHQLLVLLKSLPMSQGIINTNNQLARVIDSQEFTAVSLAKHAINLCPEDEPIFDKLNDLYNFAESLALIGANSDAAKMANTLYHSIITLVSLAHQTNTINYSSFTYPDLY